eukprot:10355586-Prorocentrum_lima.AAC.1
MTSSLVGSEMCIRDRAKVKGLRERHSHVVASIACKNAKMLAHRRTEGDCLLYTSDAADDM